MSKIYEEYKKIKLKEIEESNEQLDVQKPSLKKLYLFKSGIFYILLNEDAEITSKLLNLKITNFAKEVIKTGFPIKSYEKYKEFLNIADNSYEFIIINIPKNTTSTQEENIEKKQKNTEIKESNIIISQNTNLNINKLIFKLKNVNITNLTIKEAYEFIEELKTIALNNINIQP